MKKKCLNIGILLLVLAMLSGIAYPLTRANIQKTPNYEKLYYQAKEDMAWCSLISFIGGIGLALTVVGILLKPAPPSSPR
ncbi:MAG TPA: hypothetical protein DET40_02290 [Lentisphaeria bacterium]|nr:MAG: hypothetical protein A2X45_16890 [Lentisphaerae bacterium GWF2_50_93]HCE42361.1 hypothetical protein [Lentisphaeria bacterium]